jgi:MraZ protein
VERDEIAPEKDFDLEGGFCGDFIHTLDGKRRLTIPSVWRGRLGTARELFVLPGVNDKCLCVYPAREMTRLVREFRKLRSTDRRGRRLTRVLSARGELLEWDGNGRIRVKDPLLEHAAIRDQVMLVGDMDHFELWNPEQWEQEKQAVELGDFDELAQYLGL